MDPVNPMELMEPVNPVEPGFQTPPGAPRPAMPENVTWAPRRNPRGAHPGPQGLYPPRRLDFGAAADEGEAHEAPQE